MKTKRILSLLLTSTMMLTVATGLVGCKKDKATVSTNTSTKKDDDQHLNLFLLEPLTLDPNEASDVDSFTIINEMQEGLARIKVVDGKDKIEPAGAKSWETSKDGLTWTFHLRDYKWSDGVQVTAQQYVDSFQRLLKKENAFSYAYYAYEIKGAEDFNKGTGKSEDVGVVAKDDKTLVINLVKPTPYFEKKFPFVNFGPIRLDVIKKGGENWKTDIAKQVYCGPYKIKEWVKNNSMTFEKNPTYWDADNVFVKTAEMNAIPEFSTQAQLFESSQLDVTGCSQEYVKKWQDEAKAGKFQFAEGDKASTGYLAFNNDGGPSGLMSNKKIRLAMSLAFDREDYINTLLSRYSPAYGWIPKSLQSGKNVYRDEVKEPLKDLATEYVNKPEKLQALFKEGLKELGVNKDLSKIKIKYITVGDSSAAKQTNEWWQQQFKTNLGIDLSVEVFGTAPLLEQAKKDRKWDACYGGWGADFDDPINFFEVFASEGDNNKIKYNNPEYNKIIKDLETEIDPANRVKKYQKLEAMLVKDDVALAPIFYQDTRRFSQNYVKDFMSPHFGATYEWRWAYTSGRK
ncbi:peptide ABC transporter substrate-binding protein [Clostridium sp. CM028]|uniref:peptide ABC transporter substrate-binding protein n=1 Tax=Clostridium sp. CM028 TaxID=2851575 RepID=UPI001C6EE433|nr:peptide ABC transporter substrate-binding protein [Clostridium sp. CM028]MBW9148953.1 peptide ABC transporter substrate-binding protein [Clostridium sp. CM028]WLC62949.1 peptide ABC transporter substrate-binding protein [Clostridium sp. CM028]